MDFMTLPDVLYIFRQSIIQLCGTNHMLFVDNPRQYKNDNFLLVFTQILIGSLSKKAKWQQVYSDLQNLFSSLNCSQQFTVLDGTNFPLIPNPSSFFSGPLVNV